MPPTPEDELAPDDLEVEIDLRPPGEVAVRLVILGAVCRRAFLETQPGGAHENPEADRFDLHAWLREEGLAPALSPSEARLLRTPVGRVGDEDAAAASWQTEALVALGWALRLVAAMPPYDTTADPAPLLAGLPSPWEPIAGFVRDARLRAETEIATERERAELWQWRAETAALMGDAGRGKRAGLVAAVEDVAREALEAGLIAGTAAGDFPVARRPYREVDAETFGTLSAIAAERSRALNWLCGFGRSWDDVPLVT